MFPTGMFASATQRMVLRVLAEKNKRFTIDELAALCHRSEASISRALKHADRYPFIEKDHVPGSKQLTFRLEPDSRYTAAIREFFVIEHDRERQNGTIPVDVWNLLEEVTDRFQDSDTGFVELFLFGSYATGEYYAGSDIDLLLAHTDAGAVSQTVDTVVTKIGDDRLQVIPVHIERDPDQLEDDALIEIIKERSPVGGADVLIPLTGAISK